MILALALSLLASVDVNAPPTCVTDESFDALALREGETVSVDVHDGGAPDEAGRARYAASIDIAVPNAEPLHRELDMRPLECADLPDLVARLVSDQRETIVETPRPTWAPHEPSRVRNTRRVVATPSWSPCAGPPDFGNGIALSLSAGPMLVISPPLDPEMAGMRIAADFTADVSETRFLVGIDGAYAAHRASVSAKGGLVWHRAMDGGEGSLHSTVSAGLMDYQSGGYDVVVTPGVAGRARFGWMFIEAGALVQITTQSWPAPGLYGALGVHI